MRVAITHDYLIDFGGAEQVLLSLHELYPKAPVYTLVVNERGMGEGWEEFKNAKIIPSWFNNIPFLDKLISPLRFLIPIIWRGFDLSKYDLIIDSSSWAITKGFKTKKNQTEISYTHTPPRYLYGYDTSRNWKNSWLSGLIKAYTLVVNHFMRMYDFESAQKVDHFIANSKNVQARIEKFYRRKSKIIYPPVNVEKIITSPDQEKENFFLTGGRMVASKNFDLIIGACKKAKVNLKIFGSGVQLNELKKIADASCEFLGELPEKELYSCYKKAKGFIVAQKDEDFGITPVEAMAAGTPVIAYRGGGYIESVIEGKTGIFFDEISVDSLVSAIKKLSRTKIDSKSCINQAKKFSKERFKKEIKEFILSRTRV